MNNAAQTPGKSIADNIKAIADGSCTDEQAASLALSLLADYRTTKDESTKTKAIRILDTIAEKIRCQIGECWCNSSELNAYSAGETAYSLIEAYSLLKSVGVEKALYLEATQDVCTYAVGHQLLDGSINVSPCITDRFDGVFFIKALVAAYLETEKHFYHVSAVRAFSYYSREFHNERKILSERKEGLLPVANALKNGGRALYEYTGYERYRDMISQTEELYDTYRKTGY